jgi:hypothetical protein
MAVIDATAAERSDRPHSPASWTPRILVAIALLLSIAAHLALLGSVLFAHPRAHDAPATKSIMVDLVPAKDVKPAAKPDLPEPEPPKLEIPKPEPPKPALEKVAANIAPKATSPPASQPQPSAAAQPLPLPASKAAQSKPHSAPTVPEEAGTTAVRLAQLLHLSELTPNITFEAPPSANSARLSRNDIAAFKAHLKTCWKPPAGLPRAATLKAAIRVALRRNGRFSTQPILLAATASIHGPALVKSALAALAQCQPYTGLRASKYREWKQLDLTFTSREILDVSSGKGFGAKNAKR